MHLREYDFENKKHPTFNEDDIINIFPIVKHVEPQVCFGVTILELILSAMQRERAHIIDEGKSLHGFYASKIFRGFVPPNVKLKSFLKISCLNIPII